MIDREIVGFIAFIVLCIGAMLLGGNSYVSWRCSNFEQMTGKDTEYVWFDACYVEHRGRKWQWEEYKSIRRDVEIEGDNQ